MIVSEMIETLAHSTEVSSLFFLDGWDSRVGGRQGHQQNKTCAMEDERRREEGHVIVMRSSTQGWRQPWFLFNTKEEFSCRQSQ